MIGSASAQTKLTIVWHRGVLGDALKELCAEYTKQTGVPVKVDLVEWDGWHDAIASDFSRREGRYDLTIFDSQSMSEFASQGHVLLFNPYLKKSSRIKAADYDPASLRQYAEYPEGSSKLYALPLNPDVMGLAYRKDLFEDAVEKEAFQAKYGYELKPPETYDQLKDIAEFFTRPAKRFYGIALFGSQKYDAATSSFNNFLWSFGGELWDPKTRKSEGVLNGAAAVSALTFYQKLFEYAPPGATVWFYDEVNRAINSGSVAMAINWYYFFGAYSNPRNNPYSTGMAYSPLPGQKGEDGQVRQFNMIGGQGISISKYSKHPAEAWKFLEWFMGRDVQWKWVQAGAQTGRIDILKSTEYAKASPYNSIFPVSMSRVKDYWHLVEYPELLEIYQKYVYAVIAGKMPAQDALDLAAKEQQAILTP